VGGDSVRALQLVARIKAEIGPEIPIVAVFRERTIERLARALPASLPGGFFQPSPTPLLVSLREGREMPTLVCVHPLAGDVVSYFDLARALRADRAVLAIRARGFHANESVATSVHQMATDYAEELMAAAFDSRLALLGWSLGGRIAFEMAVEMERRGRRPELLAIVDVAASTEYEPPGAGGVWRYARDFWGIDLREELAGLDPDAQIARFLEEFMRRGLMPLAAAQDVRRRVIVFGANLMAAKAYAESTRYGGRVVVFRQELDALALQQSGGTALGWDLRCESPVSVEIVPGDHKSTLMPPHVTTLAARLEARLGRSAGLGVVPR